MINSNLHFGIQTNNGQLGSVGIHDIEKKANGDFTCTYSTNNHVAGTGANDSQHKAGSHNLSITAKNGDTVDIKNEKIIGSKNNDFALATATITAEQLESLGINAKSEESVENAIPTAKLLGSEGAQKLDNTIHEQEQTVAYNGHNTEGTKADSTKTQVKQSVNDNKDLVLKNTDNLGKGSSGSGNAIDIGNNEYIATSTIKQGVTSSTGGNIQEGDIIAINHADANFAKEVECMVDKLDVSKDVFATGKQLNQIA